jgi:hypothetical protein
VNGESIADATQPSDAPRAGTTTDQLDEGVPLTLDYRMDSRAGTVAVEAVVCEVLTSRGLGRKGSSAAPHRRATRAGRRDTGRSGLRTHPQAGDGAGVDVEAQGAGRW